MSKQVTLALLGFNAKLQAAFSAILVLSEISLNDDWQIVDKKIANIIFFNSKEAISQKQWDEIELSYPKAILIAYSENLEPLDIKWKLLTGVAKPPQRSLLIVLLNKIAVILRQVTQVIEKEDLTVKAIDNDSLPIEEVFQNEGVNPAISMEDPKKQPISNPVPIDKVPEKKPVDEIIPSKKITHENKHVKDQYFIPDYYFLGIVQKSIQTGKIYHCKTPCNINIYLFPRENSYFCSLNISDLSSLFLIYIDEIKIKEISEKELKKDIENMKSDVLTDLLWHSAVIASRGRLMKNHHHDTVVHLRYWPDISYINTSENYLIIAIFMQYNAIDIQKIAGYTEQTVSDVINFHNACNALGLIDYDKKFSLNSKPASDKLRQLRQRIFKMLRLNITS